MCLAKPTTTDFADKQYSLFHNLVIAQIWLDYFIIMLTIIKCVLILNYCQLIYILGFSQYMHWLTTFLKPLFCAWSAEIYIYIYIYKDDTHILFSNQGNECMGKIRHWMIKFFFNPKMARNCESYLLWESLLNSRHIGYKLLVSIDCYW